MQKVQLGQSDLRVSRLGLGTWNMSEKDDWGPGSRESAVALIHHALDGGCNFIDTSPGYGRAEATIGRALAGGRRDGVILATKFVHSPPGKLEAAIERSLRRLRTDVIDLFICHWPDPRLDFGAFFDVLAQQRATGRIRAIGVSNFNLAQMRIVEPYDVVSLQPPFSILWRFAPEIMTYCRKRSIAVTPYSPLAQGLLSGRFSRGHAAPTGPRQENVLFAERMFPEALNVARAVDAVADSLGCTSAQVALAWVLRTPGVTCPIVGASHPGQWDQSVAALSVELPDEAYRRLDDLGRRVWGMVDAEDPMWGWKPGVPKRKRKP